MLPDALFESRIHAFVLKFRQTSPAPFLLALASRVVVAGRFLEEETFKI